MKSIKFILVATLALTAVSCSQRVAYTNVLSNEYDLTPQTMKRLQFYTSSQIILERRSQQGNQQISADGKLVVNERNKEDRIIINPSTKCVFEKDGERGEVFIRFEVGDGKTLKFAARQNQQDGKYYLVADWKSGKASRYCLTLRQKHLAQQNSIYVTP